MNNEDKVFIRFTDAPESYDYGNTSTVCHVGTMTSGINKGQPLRMVRIQTEHSLRFQELRYRSGFNLFCTLEELEEMHDLIGEIDMKIARDC